MLAIPALVVFPSLMAFAAATDLFTMTISNKVSAALLVGFIVFAVAVGLPIGVIAYDVSCGVAILALTFALFAAGVIGGGDAKLAATTALWVGWPAILDYGLISSLIGGVLTLSIIWLRGRYLPPWLNAQAWLARIHDPCNGVPYGIALAAAGLLVYPHTEIWRAVARSG